MESRKLSLKTMIALIASICLVLCFMVAMPLLTKTEKSNVSAATSSITINFSGFDATDASVKQFCVVKYLRSGGVFTSQIVTSSQTIPVASGGKVELTVPMYCSVTFNSTTGVNQNNNTYYIDTTTATVTTATITYSDKGYFGSTTIVA